METSERRDSNEQAAPQAAQVLRAACAAPLTRLELNSAASLQQLAAWPDLQELRLRSVRPTSITAQQLAQLAAAPSLRRLAFAVGKHDTDAQEEALSRETGKLRELRQALPCCAVELC
ncbi:F-box-like domain [Chlorella sorokiniana]|uniref:F-box-like domain n=1 Tax=Chlorella sorokiniana TaxID=3076 RepID=A0A2P6TGN8_CHLSO|nr:F-box-like domain [Chlorella sorokiniana]|eukprot:PRW33282.1 F-box-like domain [Chlorella sorokiniana]